MPRIANVTPTTDVPTHRLGATSALTQRERLLVAAIAEHVAHLLQGRRHVRLVDAATLAAELGVSRDFVYTHTDELGGKRIGDGPRGRLRFDLDQALAVWASRSTKASREPKPPPSETSPPRRRKRATGVLLPIRRTAASFESPTGR